MTMKKIICFRFDVDTYICASKGVKNLLELAERLSVKFSLFYNMGRGIHHKSFILKKKSGDTSLTTDKLPTSYKLGTLGYLRTAFLNPYVGKAYPHIILEAEKAGHEIGLHGGRNHGDWMANANTWAESRVKDEISWGLSELNRIGISSVTSFSSPGWRSTVYLHDILRQNGFSVVADDHGHGLETITKMESAGHCLYSVPTNLLGEPGGVGYIENMRAQNMTNKEILDKFQDDLNNINKLAVVYDHPFYSGINELAILESMINTARELGFYFAKFNEIPKLMALE